MHYPILAELQQAVEACRAEAKGNSDSQCNSVAQVESYGGDRPLITVPLPESLDHEVQIVTVGINPRWTMHSSIAEQGNPTGQKKGPATFNAYKRTILGDVPDEKVAHLELVQCGTPDGTGVGELISRCRQRFFDKAIEELQPMLIISIGQWASWHLYENNTAAGRAGQPWNGMMTRHATSERVSIAGHECAVVFVMQPSSRRATMKRRFAAGEEIARVIADL